MEIKLTELFEVQRKLDAEIERKHPAVDGEDRFSKRILALLVELGECANEWRGFKFWSTDQAARTMPYMCKECDEYKIGITKSNNPLLEEYVDVLHFILSVGLDLNLTVHNVNTKSISNWDTIEKQFNYTSHVAGYLPYIRTNKEVDVYYLQLWHNFIGLGEMLGFTWQQIETAYMSKNATNWERQANGY